MFGTNSDAANSQINVLRLNKVVIKLYIRYETLERFGNLIIVIPKLKVSLFETIHIAVRTVQRY